MTFYEAALRVLETAGKPLHVQDITQQSVDQNLLSHIGKLPEQTMLSRLAAMARRPRDRRVMVTAKDTFGLVEWQLVEDAEALAVTGVPEPNPEEDLPPLRPEERHPVPQSEMIRSVGRGERRRRHEDHDGGRRRRFPPLAEVVFELLSEGGEALSVESVVSMVVSKEQAPEELSAQKLLTTLLEDNQRRIDAGRRPQFGYQADSASIFLESPDSSTPALALQRALATAAGVPIEDGRPLLRLERAPAEAGDEGDKVQAATLAVKDARRSMVRALRRRLSELDAGALEKAVSRLLFAAGFREVKVARRSKEGPLFTCRRRDGSLEWRYAIRLLRSSGPVDRRSVQEVRRDLTHQSSQFGLLLSLGELRGDARAEATSGPTPIGAWCGEGLAEKFLESRVGVQVETVELYELDEAFFEKARQDAEAALARRDERSRERHLRAVGGDGSEAPENSVETGTEASGELDSGGEEEGEGASEAMEAGAGAPEGDKRRRRRRRRRRRGGGGEGAAATSMPGESAAAVEGASAPPAAPVAEAPAAPVDSSGTES